MYQLFDMRPPMRIALFLGLTGIGMIAGALISFSLVAALLHIPFADMQKVLLQPEYASMAQLANALASIIAFGLPSIVLALMAKENWHSHLGFTAVKSYQQIGIVILLALTGLMHRLNPLMNSYGSWTTSLFYTGLLNLRPNF